jgi:hypothetical protein
MRAMRAFGSMSTCFMRDKLICTELSRVCDADQLWPPERAVTCQPRSFAILTAATTSASPSANTMALGNRLGLRALKLAA